MIPALQVVSFPFGAYAYVDILVVAGFIIFAATFYLLARNHERVSKQWGRGRNTLRFLYAIFVKPHSKDGETGSQQVALEGFYKAQVSQRQGIDGRSS